MKTRIYQVVILILISFSGYSQETSVKVYSNFLILNSQLNPYEIDYEAAPIAYNGLTFAYRKVNPSSVIHQFEGSLSFGKRDDSSYKYNRKAFHIRYEYGKYFKKLADGKFRISLTGAVKIYGQNEDIEMSPNHQFPQNNIRAGINLTTIGGIEYDLTERIYLELGLSLVGIGFNVYYYETSDPSRIQPTVVLQSITGFSERFIRFGMGYKFVN